MRHGISGQLVDPALRYAAAVNAAAVTEGVSPALLYAIAYRETISGEAAGFWTASSVVSPDGGHGLCQITSPPIPMAWSDPLTNATAAARNFIQPALALWAPHFSGDALVKLVACSYNEGYGAALYWHGRGDADRGTTDHYGAAVLAYYTALVEGDDLATALA